MMTDKTYQLGRIKDAIRDYKQARAKLFRPDGEPRYGEAEQAERLEEIQQALDRRIANVDDAVGREKRKLEAELTALDRPAIFQFTGDDLTRATQLAGLVESDVEGLPPDALRAAVEAAIAADDRAALAGYQHVIGRWLAVHQRAGVTSQLSGEARARREVLRPLSEQVDQALSDPATNSRRARLRREMEDVAAVEQALREARGQGKGAIKDHYLRQVYGSRMPERHPTEEPVVARVPVRSDS